MSKYSSDSTILAEDFSIFSENSTILVDVVDSAFNLNGLIFDSEILSESLLSIFRNNNALFILDFTVFVEEESLRSVINDSLGFNFEEFFKSLDSFCCNKISFSINNSAVVEKQIGFSIKIDLFVRVTSVGAVGRVPFLESIISTIRN